MPPSLGSRVGPRGACARPWTLTSSGHGTHRAPGSDHAILSSSGHARDHMASAPGRRPHGRRVACCRGRLWLPRRRDVVRGRRPAPGLRLRRPAALDAASVGRVRRPARTNSTTSALRITSMSCPPVLCDLETTSASWNRARKAARAASTAYASIAAMCPASSGKSGHVSSATVGANGFDPVGPRPRIVVDDIVASVLTGIP